MGQCAAKSRLKDPRGKLPRSHSFNDVMERQSETADDLAGARQSAVVRSKTVSLLQAWAPDSQNGLTVFILVFSCSEMVPG